MAKSLPDSIDIATAVRKSWRLSGSISLSDLGRMPAHLMKQDDRQVRYEMAFEPCEDIIGVAHIKIESEIELICQRSLEHFDFQVKVNRTVGFINRLEDESKLKGGVAPSWVEGETIDPKALIEDEMMLKVPEFPIKPGAELESEYLTDHEEHEPAEETHNPFAVLKDLK